MCRAATARGCCSRVGNLPVPKLDTPGGGSGAKWPKSGVDLTKSVADLIDSLVDLIKSVADLIDSRADLIKSVADLIDSLADLIKSDADLIKSLAKFDHRTEIYWGFALK